VANIVVIHRKNDLIMIRVDTMHEVSVDLLVLSIDAVLGKLLGHIESRRFSLDMFEE